MNTERNWSSIRDYEGGNFGLRSFYTREQWLKQITEWHEYDPFLCNEEWVVFNAMLNKMDDEEFMGYIQENWNIEIRETTWLKVGNECLWHTGVAGYKVKIIDIPMDDVLQDNTGILIEHNGVTMEVIMDELYGLTDETCPKCGHPLYVSDLCSYQYVCLECDENFC